VDESSLSKVKEISMTAATDWNFRYDFDKPLLKLSR